jgi:hypothetical protein
MTSNNTNAGKMGATLLHKLIDSRKQITTTKTTTTTSATQQPRPQQSTHSGKRNPDSESAHRKHSKSGLGSDFGPQTCVVVTISGGGTAAGEPKFTRVRPSRIQ